MPETMGRGRASPGGDLIDFGDLQPAVNALLQQGVAAYRTSKTEGEALFRMALELALDALSRLEALDPEGRVGWRVISDLLAGVCS